MRNSFERSYLAHEFHHRKIGIIPKVLKQIPDLLPESLPHGQNFLPVTENLTSVTPQAPADHSQNEYSLLNILLVLFSAVILKTYLDIFKFSLPHWKKYVFLVGSTVSKLVMFLALHIFRKIYNNHFHFSMPLAYWVRLMLIPFSTFYIIHNTYILTSGTDNTIFFTITTILLITVNYAAFDLYDKLGEKAEIERKTLAYEQQLDLCNKQATERELAYQETRRVRHDINKYLFDIQTSLLAGNLSEAKNKIDNLLEHNQIYRKEICRSGNLIIDSLINNKYSIVEKMGIKMNCNVFLPNQISIESYDLCIIIGKKARVIPFRTGKGG